MMPTKERGQTGIFIDCGREKILFDCGENIQRQMRIAGISPAKVTRVFLSHWHGDHVLGLPGLLENIAKNSFEKKIWICGTKEIRRKLNQLVNTFNIRNKLKIEFKEIRKSGVFLKEDNYEFGAQFLKHSLPCLGYYIKEKDRLLVDKKKMKKFKLPSGPIMAKIKSKKDVVYKGKKIKWKDITYTKYGKKIGLCLDTAECAAVVKIGKDSDVFVCESTYLNEKKDAAKKFKHMTAHEAGKVAKKAKAKKLVITHFSQRYDNKQLDEMKKEAKKAFGKEVVLADDFMTIEV